jgi:predicted metal-dependent peptidase
MGERVMNKKAYEAVVRARTILIISQPFFGTLALHLTIVEVANPASVSTMAVDGINIYYNPEFVLGLTEEETVGVIAHEVFHCAFSHFSRRGHRDPRKWNIAGDFCINNELKKVPFMLPWTPSTLDQLMAGKHGHLYDPQFANMSTEEIYEKIPDPPEQPGGGGNGTDDGGCGAVLDAGAGQSPDAEKVSAEQVAHDWQANVRMAVNVARANNAGNTPGYLERLVTQLKRPKVSWRDLTRQFIDQSMTTDYSYRRPNRRYISSGLILPGNVPDALHELVMFIDVSGSISEDMMHSFISEVAGALDDGTCDKLWVVYADAKVQHVDEFGPGDVVTCKTPGGGGTDFADSFKWLNKNAPDAAAAIYLTDMETCSFGEEPNMAVLWGCYNSEAFFNSVKPPFGTKIFVESPQ